MKQIRSAVDTGGHGHPEYDFPNETGWNFVVVFWGIILIVMGAIITAYLH